MMIRAGRKQIGLLVGLAILLAGGFLCIYGPDWYWKLQGSLRNESFYAHRPTSYWKQVVRATGYLDADGTVQLNLKVVVNGRNDWLVQVPGISGASPQSGAVEDLPLVGEPAALSVMMDLLRDDDPYVQVYAILGIMSLKRHAKPAIPSLKQAAGSGHKTVATFARIALVQLSSSAEDVTEE